MQEYVDGRRTELKQFFYTAIYKKDIINAPARSALYEDECC